MTANKPHLVLIGGDGGRSGVPRHIEQICRALRDAGAPYRITVVSEPDTGGYAFAQGLSVTHVPVRYLASSTKPHQFIKGFRALKATLRADPPDIVWAHARLPVMLARMMSHKTARLIVTFHGSPFAGRRPKTARAMRQIERTILRRAQPHDIIFLSDHDRQSFDGLPLSRHATRILPNVAPDLEVGPLTPPAQPTLVMTTRDSPQKNLDGAADIFAHLSDTTRLVLLGMGTDTQALKSRFATRLDKDAMSRVTFGGPVEDITPYLRCAHGYLMTSRYEGMSMGALEAFAAGLPVFMPNIGGSSEILAFHPLCAIIDPNTPKRAAGQITDILTAFQSDPACGAHISAAYHGAFSPDDWRDGVLDIVASALAGHTG